MSSVYNYLSRSAGQIMGALNPPISSKTALMLKAAGLTSVMALATLGGSLLSTLGDSLAGEAGNFSSNIIFTALGSAYVFHVVERLERPRGARMPLLPPMQQPMPVLQVQAKVISEAARAA